MMNVFFSWPLNGRSSQKCNAQEGGGSGSEARDCSPHGHGHQAPPACTCAQSERRAEAAERQLQFAYSQAAGYQRAAEEHEQALAQARQALADARLEVKELEEQLGRAVGG